MALIKCCLSIQNNYSLYKPNKKRKHEIKMRNDKMCSRSLFICDFDGKASKICSAQSDKMTCSIKKILRASIIAFSFILHKKSESF